MRYIAKPEPLKLNANSDKPAEFGLDRFIGYLIDNEPRFNNNGAAIRAAQRIERAVLASKDAEHIAVESTDYELLRTVAEAPQCDYPIRPARGLVPFLTAIAEASEEAPS